MTHMKELANIVGGADFGSVVNAVTEAKKRLMSAEVSIDEVLRIPSGGYTSGDQLLDAALLAVISADSLYIDAHTRAGRYEQPEDAEVIMSLEQLSDDLLTIPVTIGCADSPCVHCTDGQCSICGHSQCRECPMQDTCGLIVWDTDLLERGEGPELFNSMRSHYGVCRDKDIFQPFLFPLMRRAFGLTF